MEVHHHSHTSRKKWTHYFWEFLMLFFAVFCGFMAEYQLEHKIEKEREQEYIKSLVADLKNDQAIIDRHLSSQKSGIEMMDTMITILNDPELIRSGGDQLYYIARVGPRTTTFASNNKTFEQLKNAGGFRLIRNNEAASRIMSYYNILPFLHQLEGLYNSEFADYKKLVAKIFEPTVFRRQEEEAGGVNRSTDNPQVRNTSPELLKDLGIYSVYLNGTRRGILPVLDSLKITGSELILYLEKEYELKKKDFRYVD